MAESIDLAFGEEIGEIISADHLALRRVEDHDFPVAHVVPIIQRDEESPVGYKEINGSNRIKERDGRG